MAATPRAKRLFLLQYGAERVPKALSVVGGGSVLGWEPIVGVLVDTEEGWILLETGMGRMALGDAEAQQGYARAAHAAGAELAADMTGPALPPVAPEDRRWTWGLAGEPMQVALDEHGLTPADLTLAAVSHLHLDHTGGLPALAKAGVPVAVQRIEHEFAHTAAASADEGYYATDWRDHNVRWQVLDGDEAMATGVHALFTPGHTPGHMSYRVELEQTGTWIFAVDAADLGQNIHDGVPPGSCSGEPELAEQSLQRLIADARARNARLVPGHDQLVWNAARHPIGGHR